MSSRYVPKSRRNPSQDNNDYDNGYQGTSNWNSNHSEYFGNQEEENRYYQEQTDAIMNDTLATSRNILRKLDQTEQIGVQNMNLLAESDERLHNIHAKAKNINDKTDRANQHATELKKYNRAFFLPVISFSSKKRK